jgi:hypothetical protein
MNSHIDADGLAEYRVGLITGRDGRQIADHLAICAQCASVADRLAEVSVLLAAALQPAIPDAVAERLQAALDAEPPIYAEHPVAASARSRFRLPRFKVPRLVPPRVLAPAAALAVLAGGGFWLSQLAGSSASGPAFSGSAEAGPAAGSTASSAASSADHSAQISTRAPFTTGHANEGMDIGVNRSLMVTASDTDLRAATLGSQLGALLSSRSRLHSTQASAAVRACVSAVAASHPVTLVASARYGGSPATVVIVNESGRYQAIVAGPNCSNTDRDILATTVVPTGISTP